MTENQTEQAEVNLDKVLDRVRKLLAKANGTDNPIEAKTYQEAADAMMLKYRISQITAEQDIPLASRVKPGTMTIVLGDYNEILWAIYYLADYTARHCRCMVDSSYRYDRNLHQYTLKVYGFQADLKYFELMFTGLQLHMLGAFLPKIQTEQSLEENCYRLHNAGYNWLQIAEMYGWHKVDMTYRYGPPELLAMKVPFEHKDGTIRPATQVGSHYKRAYYRAVEAKGEQPIKIPAGTLEAFRRSAIDGYLNRINRRMREIAKGRLAGSDVMLAADMKSLQDLWDEDHPKVEYTYEECENCKKAKSGHCRQHPRGSFRTISYSEAGYAAGTAHANTADLNPAATGGSRTALS